MELTGKQKRFLRSRGQQLKPSCVIGKGGLSEGVADKISKSLVGRELIKVRLPADPTLSRKELAGKLAEVTGACCVGLVGRTALLYRPDEQADPDDRIHLP